MSIKFFGQFLLGRYIINAQQLLEALHYQEHRNLKFGEYALAKSYITQQELTKLLNEQRLRDEKIGEIAQDLSILTAEQVEEILTIQKNDHLLLGQILVEKGFISPELLKEELALFETDQSAYIPGEISIPQNVSYPELVIAIVDVTQKLLGRIAQIQAKAERGITLSGEVEQGYLTVCSSLRCENLYDLILSLSTQEIARAITAGIIGMPTQHEPDDIVVDGVQEFCNIVSGNIFAKMAKIGRNMEIEPPYQIHDLTQLVNAENIIQSLQFPLVTPIGSVHLFLIEHDPFSP